MILVVIGTSPAPGHKTTQFPKQQDACCYSRNAADLDYLQQDSECRGCRLKLLFQVSIAHVLRSMSTAPPGVRTGMHMHQVRDSICGLLQLIWTVCRSELCVVQLLNVVGLCCWPAALFRVIVWDPHLQRTVLLP